MKKATFFFAIGFAALAWAGPEPKPGPFKPYEFYNEVHQRVMREIETRKLSIDFMGQAIRTGDPQATVDAFSPFRPIAVQAAVELARRNKIDFDEATEVALRAATTSSVFSRACEAGSKEFKAEPLNPELFASEFPRNYVPGSEFLENQTVTKSSAQSVTNNAPVATEKTFSKSAPEAEIDPGTRKVAERLNVPMSVAKQFCALGETIADSAFSTERIGKLKDAVKNEMQAPIEEPVKPIQNSVDSAPVNRPTPVDGPTRPLTVPIALNNGLRPEPKPTGETRPEPTDEPLTAGGAATHRGGVAAVSNSESIPTNAVKREERLSPEVVDSIIRQTINDKLLTRDMDRRTADELTERLSSAYKREGDLTAAFAQVQKEMTDPAIPRASDGDGQTTDGNSRVTPVSGSPEETLMKEFADTNLKEKDAATTTASVSGASAPASVGIGPAAGLIAVPSPSDTVALATGTLSALNAKNALNWNDEVKVPNPTSTTGTGGGSLQDGKASTFGGDTGAAESGGALGTLFAGGKTERPTLQTVKGRIQSFLDSVAKAFKPRSLTGGALRGIASVENAGVEGHAEDETSLALASFGESSGEWTGASVPNIWIPIGFFLGAFAATLGAFLGWQRWRNRR